jgi:hypothetical protein
MLRSNQRGWLSAALAVTMAAIGVSGCGSGSDLPRQARIDPCSGQKTDPQGWAWSEPAMRADYYDEHPKEPRDVACKNAQAHYATLVKMWRDDGDERANGVPPSGFYAARANSVDTEEVASPRNAAEYRAWRRERDPNYADAPPATAGEVHALEEKYLRQLQDGSLR